jgi:hypothetical protein
MDCACLCFFFNFLSFVLPDIINNNMITQIKIPRVHPATTGIIHGGRNGRANDRARPETGCADPPSRTTVSPLQGNTAECALARFYLLSQANCRYAFAVSFRLVLLLLVFFVWQSCRPLFVRDHLTTDFLAFAPLSPSSIFRFLVA